MSNLVPVTDNLSRAKTIENWGLLPPYTLCKLGDMKLGKYTLPDEELAKISRREHLDEDQSHFRSGVYEEAEENGLAINLMTPYARRLYHEDKPEYIVWYADGTPLGWFSENEQNWVLPKLNTGMASPSLYRISSYIRGLRDGMIAAVL